MTQPKYIPRVEIAIESDAVRDQMAQLDEALTYPARVTVKLTREQRATLRTLAASMSCSMADVIRSHLDEQTLTLGEDEY